MYLHLGQETVVRTDHIIGIFDLENTSISKYTKDFLKQATDHHTVVNVSYEMPKSYVLCKETDKTVLYISQIATATLLKRVNQIAKRHS